LGAINHASNINIIIFGLTRLVINLTIARTQRKHINNYSIGAVLILRTMDFTNAMVFTVVLGITVTTLNASHSHETIYTVPFQNWLFVQLLFRIRIEITKTVV